MRPFDRPGKPADTLQKVNLPVINNGICSSWYNSQGKHVTLSSRQFCAGFEEGSKDACQVMSAFFCAFLLIEWLGPQGDSGGPMLLRDSESGRYTVMGVVSAGIGCALRRLPGIYTRVNAYVPWINKYIFS